MSFKKERGGQSTPSFFIKENKVYSPPQAIDFTRIRSHKHKKGRTLTNGSEDVEKEL